MDEKRDTRPASLRLVFPVNPGAVPLMVRPRPRDGTFLGDSILDPPWRFLPRPGSSRRRSNVRLRSRSGAGCQRVPPSPTAESVQSVPARKTSTLLAHLPSLPPPCLSRPLHTLPVILHHSPPP